MAKAILIRGSGGGISSEDVTIYSKDVPRGLAAITRDSYDEVISGSLDTTVEDADVLEDTSYYNTTMFEKRTGTMPNYSGDSRDSSGVHSEDEYIKFAVNDYGYYGEKSSVRAYMQDVAIAGGLIASKMLGGQSAFGIEGTALTDATIDSGAQMLDGYIGYGKDGNRIVGSIPSLAGSTITPSKNAQTISCKDKYMTGDVVINAISGLDASKILNTATIGGVTGTIASMAGGTKTASKTAQTISCKGKYMTSDIVISATNVQSILSFSIASKGYNKINFQWQNPSKGPFLGVVIRGSTSSYPTSATSGTLLYKGYGTNTAASGTSTSGNVSVGAGTWYVRAYSYIIIDGVEVYSSAYFQDSGYVSCNNCGCDDDCDCSCDGKCSDCDCDGADCGCDGYDPCGPGYYS